MRDVVAVRRSGGNRFDLINGVKLLALLAVICISGCTAIGPRSQASLVGRWRYQNPQQMVEYVFAKDGTFIGHVSARGMVVADFTGKWSLTPDAILYEYTSDKKGTISPGTRDRDELVSLASDAYVIQARDGQQRKYVRIEG